MFERPRQRRRSFAILVALGLSVAGCSGAVDDLPRLPIAGTVTLDGRPMATGLIVFNPPGHLSGGTKTSAAVPIKSGRFSISRWRGLVPDKYRLEIYPAARIPLDPEDGPGKAATLQKVRIPARFNTETELEVQIKDGNIKELRIEIDSK